MHQPAFVFAVGLSNSARWIADAVSHEVGHLLGLRYERGLLSVLQFGKKTARFGPHNPS
jgi:hypothetical protein